MTIGKKWRVGPNGEPIDGKRPGWFSWRHQTREVHDASVEQYRQTRGRAARQRRAAERLAARVGAAS